MTVRPDMLLALLAGITLLVAGGEPQSGVAYPPYGWQETEGDRLSTPGPRTGSEPRGSSR